jgi:hypothetical protein
MRGSRGGLFVIEGVVITDCSWRFPTTRSQSEPNLSYNSSKGALWIVCGGNFLFIDSDTWTVRFVLKFWYQITMNYRNQIIHIL